VWQLDPIALSGLTVTNTSPTTLGQATTFSATLAAGNGESYDWDFGNGATSAGGPVVSYTYPLTGVYQAVVTATNVLGSLSAGTQVTITNLPPVAVAGPPQTVWVNTPVTLDGSASFDPDGHYPLTYGWTQTGGTAIILSSAAISRPAFTTPGAPTVLTFTLAVTDAFGLPALAPSVAAVTVTQGVSNLVASNNSPKLLNSPVRFTASASGANITYLWNFADGPAVGAGNPITHTYAAAGTYAAVVTATNGSGVITATTSATITAVSQIQYLPIILKNSSFPH
jgi:PKD repeat protein